MSFAHPAQSLPRPLFSGVSGRYVHAERLTIGEVELAAGAAVPEHRHVHEQVTYVLAGTVEFTVGDGTRVLAPGECAVIPSNVPHRCRALAAARVLDVFTPARDDYR